jgi:hypothetical protein
LPVKSRVVALLESVPAGLPFGRISDICAAPTHLLVPALRSLRTAGRVAFEDRTIHSVTIKLRPKARD